MSVDKYLPFLKQGETLLIEKVDDVCSWYSVDNNNCVYINTNKMVDFSTTFYLNDLSVLKYRRSYFLGKHY
jgi:hypothetical protein